MFCGSLAKTLPPNTFNRNVLGGSSLARSSIFIGFGNECWAIRAWDTGAGLGVIQPTRPLFSQLAHRKTLVPAFWQQRIFAWGSVGLWGFGTGLRNVAGGIAHAKSDVLVNGCCMN